MGTIEQIKEEYRGALRESRKAAKDALEVVRSGVSQYTALEPAYAAERKANDVGSVLLGAIRAELEEDAATTTAPITISELDLARTEVRTLKARIEEAEASAKRMAEYRRSEFASPLAPAMSMRDAAAIRVAGHLAAVMMEHMDRRLSDAGLTSIADASYRLADALGARSNHGSSPEPVRSPPKPPLPVPGPGRDVL